MSNNTKILIVDDDPDFVEINKIALEKKGYQINIAYDPDEGWQKVENWHPDLIILDVMMDYTTEGFQVSLQLRSPDPKSEYAPYRKIPILMLTALHSTTPLRFAPDEDYLPVDDFVEKPLEPSALVEKVEKLLGK